MIGLQDRRTLARDIAQAHDDGARLKQACEVAGISVRTLHHWEQGSRQPTGAARVLVQVAQREPQALKRALAMG